MWKFNNKDITSVEEMPDNTIGFVYLIVNLTKAEECNAPWLYVGKKLLFNSSKRSLGKKEIDLLTDKRKSKFKIIKTEKWQQYCGSNKILIEDIKKGDIIQKEILYFCKSKKELSYREENELHKRDVLENKDYYNFNIGGKYYKINQ